VSNGDSVPSFAPASTEQYTLNVACEYFSFIVSLSGSTDVSATVNGHESVVIDTANVSAVAILVASKDAALAIAPIKYTYTVNPGLESHQSIRMFFSGFSLLLLFVASSPFCSSLSCLHASHVAAITSVSTTPGGRNLVFNPTTAAYSIFTGATGITFTMSYSTFANVYLDGSVVSFPYADTQLPVAGSQFFNFTLGSTEWNCAPLLNYVFKVTQGWYCV
jgi:hypothetical protein